MTALTDVICRKAGGGAVGKGTVSDDGAAALVEFSGVTTDLVDEVVDMEIAQSSGAKGGPSTKGELATPLM